jgi:hypothetical protein
MPFVAAGSCADFFLLSCVFYAVIPLPGAGMIRLTDSAVNESLPGVPLVPVLPVELQERVFDFLSSPVRQFGEIKRGIN